MESGKDPDVGLNSLFIACRVVAGTFDKKVFQLDVREDNRRIVYYRQCVVNCPNFSTTGLIFIDTLLITKRQFCESKPSRLVRNRIWKRNYLSRSGADLFTVQFRLLIFKSGRINR